MLGQSAHLSEAFVNIARSVGGSAAGAIPIVITNTPTSKIILECVLIFSSVFCLTWDLGLVSGLTGTIQLTVSECNAPMVMGASVLDIGRGFVLGGLGLGVAV